MMSREGDGAPLAEKAGFAVEAHEAEGVGVLGRFARWRRDGT